MARTRTSGEDADQLTMYAALELIPCGDGSYRAVPQRPLVMASITQAARIVGKPRDTIYRLYKADMIRGHQPSPGKIDIDMTSLHAHIQESREAGWWTPERKKRYLGQEK